MKSRQEVSKEFYESIYNFSSIITHLPDEQHYLFEKLSSIIIELKYKLQFYETKEQKIDHYINLSDLKIKDFNGCRISDIKLFDLVDLPEHEHLKQQGIREVRQSFCHFKPSFNSLEGNTFDVIDSETYTKSLIIKCLVTENGFRDLMGNKIIKEVSDYNNFELLSEVNKRILKKNNDGEN